MWMIRVVFDWQGEEVYELVGPFDRYLAELVMIGFADAPYRFGITDVRVKRARLVPAP